MIHRRVTSLLGRHMDDHHMHIAYTSRAMAPAQFVPSPTPDPRTLRLEKRNKAEPLNPERLSFNRRPPCHHLRDPTTRFKLRGQGWETFPARALRNGNFVRKILIFLDSQLSSNLENRSKFSTNWLRLFCKASRSIRNRERIP